MPARIDRLAAVAACGYTLVGIPVLESTDAEARVLQGVITGIGFIGGGAILKTRNTVKGTATAASIWNTGLIGMAVAFGRYDVALIMSLINFVTLRYIKHFTQTDSDVWLPCPVAAIAAAPCGVAPAGAGNRCRDRLR